MMALTANTVGRVRHRVEQKATGLRAIVIVILVLAASLFLGTINSIFIPLGLVMIPLTLLFYYRPPYGLLAIFVGGLLVPGGVSTGTETRLNPTVLLVILLTVLWLIRMVLHRRLQLYPSPAIPPLIALNLAVIVAFFAGRLPWFLFAQVAPMVAQIGGLGIFLISASAFLLVGHQLPDMGWLKRLVWVFLALGAIYILGRALPGSTDVITDFFVPNSTGALFWVWLVALAFSQALINQDLAPRWRLLLLGLTLVTLYISLVPARHWASGWIPTLTAVLVILWFVLPTWVRILAVLTVAGLTVFGFNMIYDFVMIGDNSYSWMTRVEAWRILVEIIKVNPFTGLGPANYYYYTPLFQILGWEVQFNSHSQYVDLVAQAGLVGLLCFLWFAWSVGRLAWRLRTRVSEGFALAYAYGALGGLAGSVVAGLLGDWLLPFVYNVGIKGMRASILGWMFLGGLVALERFTDAGSKTPERSDVSMRDGA